MLSRSFKHSLAGRRLLSSVSSKNEAAASSELVNHQRKSNSRFAYPPGMTALEDDYTEKPEYPEITEYHLWNEPRRKRLQHKLDWHDKIKHAGCPELKNFEWNMPRKYGYMIYQVNEDRFDYNSLAAYKFVTRTHVASTTSLPSQYSSPELTEKVNHFKELVKEPLLDCIQFELDCNREFLQDFNEFPHTLDLKKSQSLIPQLNRVILNILGPEVDYLDKCHIDVQPNVQAFWHVGGQEPHPITRSKRKGCLKIEGQHKAKYVKEDDPVDENIHYIGKSVLQIRCPLPPANYLAPDDPLCSRSPEEFPDRFPHFLKEFGFKYPNDGTGEKHRYAAFIPGHWSGDENRCNLMAFHPRHHLLTPFRTESPYWSAPEENEEALLSQAILASFGRLVSQALYHGFDQFTDVDYPFSTQTVITNGLQWSFFAYQLNTMKLDNLQIHRNKKQNVIWATPTESLLDPAAPTSLNDSVLSKLLSFYLNPPRPIAAQNPTPYLTQRIQDMHDDHQRAIYFRNFRDMVIQRAYITDGLSWRRPPEVYAWEKIYKIYFNSRPMDKRLRHFELPAGFPGSDPFNEPYWLVDPLRISKGVAWLMREVAARKEKEAVEAARLAEAEKYGVLQPKNKRRK